MKDLLVMTISSFGLGVTIQLEAAVGWGMLRIKSLKDSTRLQLWRTARNKDDDHLPTRRKAKTAKCCLLPMSKYLLLSRHHHPRQPLQIQGHILL